QRTAVIHAGRQISIDFAVTVFPPHEARGKTIGTVRNLPTCACLASEKTGQLPALHKRKVICEANIVPQVEADSRAEAEISFELRSANGRSITFGGRVTGRLVGIGHPKNLRELTARLRHDFEVSQSPATLLSDMPRGGPAFFQFPGPQ